jgi:hypothetical protein
MTGTPPYALPTFQALSRAVLGCGGAKRFARLFEALVYRSNPKACYTDLYGKAFPELVK